MQRRSRSISSNQHGPHEGLARLVNRHRTASWQKPPQSVDQPALEQLDKQLALHQGPVILDSFCGTGHSTRQLAETHRDALVIGIDQSSKRLHRAGAATPENCLLLQAHCEAVWRHLVKTECRIDAHYLLYPNPWPKAAHLSRRIHGHPAFTLLTLLGGIMELRSNWQVYVEEFGIALNLLGIASRIRSLPVSAVPTTRFEMKYRDSEHDLWQLTARLPDRP